MVLYVLAETAELALQILDSQSAHVHNQIFSPALTVKSPNVEILEDVVQVFAMLQIHVTALVLDLMVPPVFFPYARCHVSMAIVSLLKLVTAQTLVSPGNTANYLFAAKDARMEPSVRVPKCATVPIPQDGQDLIAVFQSVRMLVKMEEHALVLMFAIVPVQDTMVEYVL